MKSMKAHLNTYKLIASAAIAGSLLLAACAERTKAVQGPHPRPTVMSLEQAIKQAKTPQDHAQIAARYERKANKLLKSARDHKRLAKLYALTDNPKMAADSARHCRTIANKLEEAAEEMKALARVHREMAGQ